MQTGGNRTSRATKPHDNGPDGQQLWCFTWWEKLAEVNYYEERAKGRVGLITVEHTFAVSASKYGASISCQLQIWDRNSVPGWKTLTEAIHY